MTKFATRLLLVGMFLVSATALDAQESRAASQRPGVACIAMSLPTVQGADGNATDVGGAVRDLFTSYLQGPSINVISLESRLSIQATEEAKQKSCDQVLIVSLTRKRGGSGVLGRALAHAGTTAAWHTPIGGVGANVARSAAIAGAQAASEIASSTRAKDEMRLQYRLVATDGRVVVKSKEEKAKASADGEDSHPCAAASERSRRLSSGKVRVSRYLPHIFSCSLGGPKTTGVAPNLYFP